ncbi:hypothetical protein MLD38_012242 [Melastoma candidum]|uniref:Uncharacterized protein n=2 Tax=Melastoma candidum TaxID=119954 RepID=A0ACB9RE51_9MYRT|nr:hypothetical protein MLD38_012238 [Melastoma candidum]KAI4374227.1 hypothetical protein MLD38_012242 [Melastoma candidum]
MASLKLVCITMVVCMVVLASTAVDATISCNQVATSLAPCVPYARSGTGDVPGPCCDGIKKLNDAASTTPDRRAACGCMKTAASNLKDLNFDVVSTIPGKCGVNIPYKLSPSTDCDR